MDRRVHGRGWEWSVTVRVTTLKGPLAGAYYVEQLPSYYLDAGEPRGVWIGQGAGLLGLAGEVDDEAFLAVMAGMDPWRPERHLGRRYRGQEKSSAWAFVARPSRRMVTRTKYRTGTEKNRTTLANVEAPATAIATA